LQKRTLPPYATVITIDDGFSSTCKYAAELLAQFRVPVTIYVTTYYCLHQNAIFRLLVQYMFWKTQRQELSLPEGACSFAGCFSLLDVNDKNTLMWRIIESGEQQGTEDDRVMLTRRLAQLLEVDIAGVVQNRVFHIMSRDELKSLLLKGIDIQLHTHRHQFPPNECGTREIEDNRTVLEPLVGKPLRHFCYPSGMWSRKCWDILARAGIESATTCERGLNYISTPRLALKRFLDSEDFSQVEFEAEITGYLEMLRHVRSWIKKCPSP
jgi:peptidoglycan/xylan/chitin deacetylase (PgdA/CDA1 family)